MNRYEPMALCPNCCRPLDDKLAEVTAENEVRCCRRMIWIPATIVDALRARAIEEATP